MLQAPQNYLPVQQAAVQQFQQTKAPAPAPGPEFNSVKIDIIKPEVSTQQGSVYDIPYTPVYEYPAAKQ